MNLASILPHEVVASVNQLVEAYPGTIDKKRTGERLLKIAYHHLQGDRYPKETRKFFERVKMHHDLLWSLYRSAENPCQKYYPSLCGIPEILFGAEGELYLLKREDIEKEGGLKVAEAVPLNRKVPIKQLHTVKCPIDDPSALLDLLNHQEAVKALNRKGIPHICPPFEAVILSKRENLGQKAVALEICYDGNLSKLSDNRKVSFPQLLHIAKSVAQSLQALHRLGYCHHSISGRNIRFNGDPLEDSPLVEVYLHDFSKMSQTGSFSKDWTDYGVMLSNLNASFNDDKEKSINILGRRSLLEIADGLMFGDYERCGMPYSHLLEKLLELEDALRHTVDPRKGLEPLKGGVRHREFPLPQKVLTLISKIAKVSGEGASEIERISGRLSSVAYHHLQADRHPERARQQLLKARKDIRVLLSLHQADEPHGKYYGKNSKHLRPPLLITSEGVAYIGGATIGKGGYCKAVEARPLLDEFPKMVIYKMKCPPDDPSNLSAYYNHFRVLKILNQREVPNIPKMPSVAPIQSCTKKGGQKAVSLVEYYERDLSSLSKKKNIPVSQLLHIFGAIADALHGIHAEKMVHRDVKAANVFLNGDPTREEKRVEAVLSDFGLTESEFDDTLKGTSIYLAPELFIYNKMEIVPSLEALIKADWFSFGIMILEATYVCEEEDFIYGKDDVLFGRLRSDREISEEFKGFTRSLLLDSEVSPKNKLGGLGLQQLARELMRYDPLKRMGYSDLKLKLACIRCELDNLSDQEVKIKLGKMTSAPTERKITSPESC